MWWIHPQRSQEVSVLNFKSSGAAHNFQLQRGPSCTSVCVISLTNGRTVLGRLRRWWGWWYWGRCRHCARMALLKLLNLAVIVMILGRRLVEEKSATTFCQALQCAVLVTRHCDLQDWRKKDCAPPVLDADIRDMRESSVKYLKGPSAELRDRVISSNSRPLLATNSASLSATVLTSSLAGALCLAAGASGQANSANNVSPRKPQSLFELTSYDSVTFDMPKCFTGSTSDQGSPPDQLHSL